MTVSERVLVLAAKGAIQAGVRILPLVSDERLVGFAHRTVASVPYPEGQVFMERLLVAGKNALAGASDACRKRAATDFLYNYLVLGHLRRKRFKQENGFLPPYLLVISPTMKCNLRCYGCYAGSYAHGELDLATVVRVLDEGKTMGVFFVVISGGEPFAWAPLMDLFERENEIFFQVYTNGSLIDRGVAGRLSELGNVMPCISVEGFEQETDARRGKGAFGQIISAMDALRARGVLFGFSATATRQNNDLIVSDEFVDFYQEKGCFVGWYFNYVPVGRAPELDLMPTPEQRIRRRRRLLDLRETKSIILADFWNDGALTGGCIAGGKSYLHINSNGDVEPCVFTHFALDNIRDMSLEAAISSEFFRAIRERIPYCDNLLRPCMLIDHPALLRDIVRRFGAKPTHPGAEAILNDLKDAMDRYASEYGELADAEWNRHESQHLLRASGQ